MKTIENDYEAHPYHSQALLSSESIEGLTSCEFPLATRRRPCEHASRDAARLANPVTGPVSRFIEERFPMIAALVRPLGYQERTRLASRGRIAILATLLVLVATFVGSGCANYHRYRPTAVEYSGISREGEDLGDMTDAAVVSYADRVRDTLRKRFHIARIARQSSSTAQILLAGVAGITAAFTAGATTVVALAAGSVAMPQVAENFDAGGRAVAYQQAVAKISAAESAYFRARAGRSPVVPNNVLTVEGALLYESINGATDAVELFQAGILPTLEQMKRADAAELQRLGDGRTGGTSPETSSVAALEERAQKALAIELRKKELVSTAEIDRLIKKRSEEKEARDRRKQLGLPGVEEFNRTLTAIDNSIPMGKKEETYRRIFQEANIQTDSPEFKGLTAGFNRQTLVEAYRAFPAKQQRIHELVTELKPKSPAPQPAEDIIGLPPQ
jgi:hypothetical protein